MDTVTSSEIEKLKKRAQDNPDNDFVRIRLAAFESGSCNHEEYTFEKFGRVCPCGEWLTDFGD